MSAGRDSAVAAAHVRFAPKATGLLRRRKWTTCHKRLRAIAAKQPLFDHLVGAEHHAGRTFMADRFCKLQIDDQLELGWLFDREIGRLCAAQPKPDSCAIPVR